MLTIPGLHRMVKCPQCGGKLKQMYRYDYRDGRTYPRGIERYMWCVGCDDVVEVRVVA